ncbi:MAG: hypothetical protein O2924_00795 [Chloroflexi bacterium]|nr:hypothetical protein [Chloroflexota bacterium]MQC16828.1 hypothetical protein [Chloroflexota bacterium]
MSGTHLQQSPSERERIALSRAYAVLTPDQITIKPARAALIGPAIQAGLTAFATLAMALWLNVLPLWLLAILLIFVMVAGPTAVLGLVYNVLGSSFLMERKKGTCRWQQGFLGLGLGTRELVPFPRIDRIVVAGDFEDSLNSGDLQDVVRWEIQLIKDNQRVLEVASITTARPLADEALERANDLAIALGAMCDKPAVTAEIPEWAIEDYFDNSDEPPGHEAFDDLAGLDEEEWEDDGSPN